MKYFRRTVIFYLCLLLLVAGIHPWRVPNAQAESANLIANPSAETAGTDGQPDNWQKGKWGDNTTDFNYDGTAHTGDHALSIHISDYENGDAKWYFQPVGITPRTSYEFSDYYKSSAVTKLVAAVTLDSGDTRYIDLSNVPINNDWTRAKATFTAPSGSQTVTIYHLMSSNGTLTVDDATLQVAPSVSTNNPNMVPNGSFETEKPGDNNQPNQWKNKQWGKSNTSFRYLSDNFWNMIFGSYAHSGSHAVEIKMSNHLSGDAKWYFDPVTVKPGTMYRFSDYYKSTTNTEVDAAFTMSDGSSIYQLIGLPDASSNWTKFDTTFTIPAGAVKMTLFHLLRNDGTLTLDDYSLQSYKPVGFNRAMVSLTFDDGFDTAYNFALPLLQKYGYISTQYIVSGFIGKQNYLTQDQLKALAAGQEIGAHSVDHKDLTTLPQVVSTNEMADSKAQLKQWSGQPVATFAYPEGRYNSALTDIAKRYFTATRGVEVGLNSRDNLNPYDIKVQNITSTTTTDQIAAWVAQAQATKTWLVLVYHAVDPNPKAINRGQYTITPDQLDSQLTIIKDSGIPVVPMSQALAEAKSQL